MLSLFDETALFNTGNRRFTLFDIPDASLQLWEQFFEKDESDHYYETLLHNSPWQQRERKMYDK